VGHFRSVGRALVRRRPVWLAGALALIAATLPLSPGQPGVAGAATAPLGVGGGGAYWLVAADGGVFPAGAAPFLGSTGAIRLNQPIVGMAGTPSGRGYWLVASDGGIFSFGDAGFFGSTGAIRLNKPIVGMAGRPSGRGYWFVASDGGLFSYGDARFFGAAPATGPAPAGEMVATVPTPTGGGYWQISSGGRVLPFGDAAQFPALAALNHPIVGAAAFPAAAPGAATADPERTPPSGQDEPSGPAAKTRPNILFILLDDLREEGVMDVPEVLPRTKQWLQAGGTTFTQGFVTSPLCCPERATVWSGRYPHNHGVYSNRLGKDLDRDWISSRYLRDAGYRTSLVGKFITDWNFRYEPPNFDDYAVFHGGYVDADFWVKNPGDAAYQAEKAPYSTDFIAAKATEFITGYEANDDQPWFMQVAPLAPHDDEVEEGTTTSGCDLNALYRWPARHDGVAVPPWNPSPAVTVEGGKDYLTEKADKVPFLQAERFNQKCAAVSHEGQMRTLLAADEMVDTIMQRLQSNGELDNTLVVFTSDNGYSWGERGVGSKGFPYAEHVKAPFLARWDGVFPAGGVDDRLVGGEDFLPTYLAAARYTPPAFGHPLDGRSFLPGEPGKTVKLLEFGPVGRPSPPEYEAHRGIPTWASLRTAGWQYIEYYEADNTTVQWREYYDLTADPWQLDNLLVTDPGRAPDTDALAAELHRHLACAGTAGPAACP
jgi:arylsulfatase A-like enzyme